MKPVTFTYDIEHPGEYSAGICGMTDTVTITVESGDPGGGFAEEDTFHHFMLQALREWYDGALVNVRRES